MKINSTHNVKEFIIDAFGCQQDLTNPSIARESASIIKSAANKAGATVIDIHFTEYTIHGFTTVALLAESHIILTTWPELSYASINIYLCNPDMNHEVALNHIISYLKPTSYRSTWVRHLSLPKRKNRVFLAAPFTSYLKDGMFDNDKFKEINFLISFLRNNGFSVFSAHEREKFGQNLLSPEECTELDFQEMNQCDIVVALIDNKSFGVSLELGWASALKKPLILYKGEEHNYSTPLIAGISQLTDTIVINDFKSLLGSIQDLECKREMKIAE